MKAPKASGLDRLELRRERIQLTFRFTYAFHAREVRFEVDRGAGFGRVFPETFSFRADRHDPTELYLQLDDLARKPALLGPKANRRDAEVLVSRLALTVPRYLERLVARLEAEGRLDESAMIRVYEDVALLSTTFSRFVADRARQDQPGIEVAGFQLRKILYRSLLALLRRRVTPEYQEAYVAGSVDPIDPADDLSETGFFYAMESGDQDAVNRSLVRLTERAFYRWLEEVCLDESNRAFEGEDSPFAAREAEVQAAIAADEGVEIRRTDDLCIFLRRTDNRDCLRVLRKLSAWFLRQYDVRLAAAMIYHAEAISRGRVEPGRVLSRHRSRNYVAAMGALIAPFIGAAFAYARAPEFFDLLVAGEILLIGGAAVWFLFYRFFWKRDLTFFIASVPRITAGIIVGYLPIFFIDEVWGLANRSWVTLTMVAVLMGSTTLLYLYMEVERKLGDRDLAFARARQIFLLGLLQAVGGGLLITGLTGGYMAARNWSPGESELPMNALREVLPPFIGQLPKVVGVEPFFIFPAAVFVMAFLSFFIGTFLQLLWEDIPITEPL